MPGSPLVVVGGSIASLVAADAALRKGRDVELILPRSGVGGGFRPLQVDGRRLDIGVRLLEIDREDASTAAAPRRLPPGPDGPRRLRAPRRRLGRRPRGRPPARGRSPGDVDRRPAGGRHLLHGRSGRPLVHAGARRGAPHGGRGGRRPPPRGRRRGARRGARPAALLARGGLARQPRRHLPRPVHRVDVRQDPPGRSGRGARRPAPQGVDAAVPPAHAGARRRR